MTSISFLFYILIIATLNGVSFASPLLPRDPVVPTPQFPASDGGALPDPTQHFAVPAIIWIVFCGILGLGLAGAGFRGGRLTCGCGTGLLLSFGVWSAFVNSMSGPLTSSTLTSDIILTVIVLTAFFILFLITSFFIPIPFGSMAVVVAAALALSFEIVLLGDDLLFSKASLYALNWVLVGLITACAAGGLLYQQRLTLLLSIPAIGTFLLALAIDLSLNGTNGMSMGLRYFLDRNSNHKTALLPGYHPALSTRLIIGAGIILTPILAFAQHKIFKREFDRRLNSRGSLIGDGVGEGDDTGNASTDMILPGRRQR